MLDLISIYAISVGVTVCAPVSCRGLTACFIACRMRLRRVEKACTRIPTAVLNPWGRISTFNQTQRHELVDAHLLMARFPRLWPPAPGLHTGNHKRGGRRDIERVRAVTPSPARIHERLALTVDQDDGVMHSTKSSQPAVVLTAILRPL